MLGRDDQELSDLRQKWDTMSHEEKVDKLLWKMVWYHHTKHIPGTPPHEAINNLVSMLGSAAKSSDQLTKSIRWATWVGGGAACAGVIVAVVGLLI
jgi:hypothetical protein